MKKLYTLIVAISLLTRSAVFAGGCGIFISGSDATICSGQSINLNTLISGSITNPLIWRAGSLYGTPTSNTVTPPVGVSSYFAVDSTSDFCWDSAWVTVYVNSIPSVTATVNSNYNGSHITCPGATNGSAQAVGSGGSGYYSYQWSASTGNQFGDIASNLPAGIHGVTVTDDDGCTASNTVTIVSPAPVTVNIAVGTILCNGGTTTATVTATGGSGAYIGTGTFVVVAGTFTYTVTDANGCQGTNSVIVTEPTAVVATATQAQSVNCNGGTNGAATVTGSGGNPSYTYQWDAVAANQTNQVATNLGVGFYSVTITDINGCTASDDAEITKDPSPYVYLGPATTQCGGTLQFDAGDNNGLNNIIYAWSNGPTTRTSTVTSSGTYSVTVSDPIGCTATASVDAYILPAPFVNLGPDVAQCGGSVTLDGTAGPGNTYLWSDGSTLPTLTVTATGLYQVTATNTGNGCTATDLVNVTIYPVPTVDLGYDVDQCGGTVTLNAGNNGATYLWSDNSTNQTLIVSATGIYRVTVTSVDGCTGTDDINVTIRPKPSLGPNQTDSICAGQTFNLTTSDFNGFFPQVWDAANPLSVPGGLYQGIYTAPNGCTDTVYQQVVEKPLPFTPIFLAGKPDVCAGENNVAYVVNQDDAVTYQWSYDAFGVHFDDVTSSNTVDFAPTATSGTIYVSAVAKNGCGVSAPAIYRVLVHYDPVAAVISTDADNAICDGQRVTYTASGGDTYEWIVNGSTIADKSDNVLDFAVQGTGLNTIVVVAFNICGSDTTETQLLDVYETPTVNAGADTSIGLGTSVMLNGTAAVTGPFVYNWTPANLLDDASKANPVATPTDSVTFTLSVFNSFGCVASDDVTINVFADGIYDFPNLITPNGDGANDLWKINLDEIPNGNLTIFTRWGEVVYENPSYDNTWDGTFKGKALDDGTYYFIMKVAQLNNKVFKGAINIIRSSK